MCVLMAQRLCVISLRYAFSGVAARSLWESWNKKPSQSDFQPVKLNNSTPLATPLRESCLRFACCLAFACAAFTRLRNVLLWISGIIVVADGNGRRSCIRAATTNGTHSVGSRLSCDGVRDSLRDAHHYNVDVWLHHYGRQLPTLFRFLSILGFRSQTTPTSPLNVPALQFRLPLAASRARFCTRL